jgi:hypothetical protein
MPSPGEPNLANDPGNYARVEFDFTGQYYDHEDEALPNPTHERTLPAQVELARLRLNEFNAVVAALNYNQNNDIQIRPDVNGSDGYSGTRIVGRSPEGGIDPEADLVANQDFWKRLADSDRMPFQMQVGQVAGNTVWMLAPSVQYTNFTYRDRNGIRAYEAASSSRPTTPTTSSCSRSSSGYAGPLRWRDPHSKISFFVNSIVSGMERNRWTIHRRR